MFTRSLGIAVIAVALPAVASPAQAAEEVTEVVSAATPTPVPSAADLALHHYLYVEFPRCLARLASERRLAEADLALIQRRVASYRPFRSFGRYAATYTVDQSWQIELLAVRQRLQRLANREADLWRQRRAIAIQFLLLPSD